MTPQEKAIELVDKMLEFASTNDYDYEVKGAKNDYHNAKQCALIAVDLVLSEFYADDFYLEVQHEINKL
jgi:hypothetical protein